MIQSKKALTVVALSALGLAGWKGQEPADLGDVAPPPPTGRSAAAVPSPGVKPAPAPQQFVLITDGRLFEGVVAKDPEENKVIVTTPIGQMTFPERKVERIFASIQEVHAYMCDQVPEEDIDEQIRLAQWCLAKKLPAEAKEHLEQVLRLAPKHGQAKAMLSALLMDEARLARRQQMDAEVQKTAGEEEVDPNSPAPLNMAVVRGAAARMGVSDLPVIFDLPPSAANKRFREFAEGVHPVLQMYCARCHNERYDGGFQLVDTRKKADQTLDALRVNLDATLRLVDRETPGRSELLASTLRPHSKGMSRPIFVGSNDRAYQILATWVGNLRARPILGAAPAADPLRAGPADGEMFAADRGRITRSTVDVDPITGPAASAPPPARRHFETPPLRFQPGQGWTEDKGGEADAPVPFSVSGVMPQTPSRPTDGAVQTAAAPAPAPESPSHPRLPEAIARAQAEAEARLSGGAPPLPVDEKGRPITKSKSSKPMNLDPALLQKTLQQKNGDE